MVCVQPSKMPPQSSPRTGPEVKKDRSGRTITILKSGVPNEQTLRDEIRRVLERCNRSLLTHKMLRRVIEKRLRLEPKVLDKIKVRVCDYAELFSEELKTEKDGGKKRPRTWEDEREASVAEAGGGRSSSLGDEEIISLEDEKNEVPKPPPVKKKRKTQADKFLSLIDL